MYSVSSEDGPRCKSNRSASASFCTCYEASVIKFPENHLTGAFGFARSWILNARVALSPFFKFFPLSSEGAADVDPIDTYPPLFACGAKYCPLRS